MIQSRALGADYRCALDCTCPRTALNQLARGYYARILRSE